MLLGRGVEDHGGLLQLEDPIDRALVGDVADDRPDLDAGKPPSQLLVDVEEWRLGSFVEDQPAGAERCQLAAELRADAPTGAGHQYGACRPTSCRIGSSGMAIGSRRRRSSTRTGRTR